MASVTLTAEADVTVRRDDDLAAGLGDHLPVGYWSGAIYRSVLRFPIPSGWLGWSAITGATLNIYVTDHSHVGVRNSNFYVRRYGGTLWTKAAGTQDCESGYSAGNNTQSSDIGITSTDQVSTNSGSTVNLKRAVGVTGLVRWYWDNAQSKIVLILDPVGSADYMEFWSREHGSYAPTLVIDYETEAPPLAPTLLSPAAAAVVDDTTPTFSWTHNATQSDPQLNAEVQIYDAAGTTVLYTWPVAGALATLDAPVALTRGTTYQWSVHTQDVTGYGAYAAKRAFSVKGNPVVTISATRKMLWSNGAPRLQVDWTSDQPITAWRVQTAAGYDSGLQSGSNNSHVLSTQALVDNVAQNVTVTVQSVVAGDTLTGTASRSFTPRYGLTTHRRDIGISPPVTGWASSVADTVLNGGEVKMQYGSSASAGAAPDAWIDDSITTAPPARYAFWRAWFIPTASASPVLNQVDIVAITSPVVALGLDKWSTVLGGSTFAAPWKISEEEYVYGSRSVMCDNVSGDPTSLYSQPIILRPGRSYILTGLMKSVGNSGAQLRLVDRFGATLLGGGVLYPDGSEVKSTELVQTTEWFDQSLQVVDVVRYSTPVYQVGGSLPETVYVRLRAGNGAASANSKAYFDAIKLEESTVATPWSPGAVGASILDAGGVQVDGKKGGVFRYRGTDGAGRSVVEGYTKGLRFGGDTELESPSDGTLAVDGVAVSLAGHSHGVASSLMGSVAGLSGSYTTATEVAVTGSTVTFTAIAGHSYLMNFGCLGSSTVAQDVLNLRLKEGAANPAVLAMDVAAASRNSSGAASYIAQGLSAGSHSFSLAGLRANGTGTMTISSIYLHVIDLG